MCTLILATLVGSAVLHSAVNAQCWPPPVEGTVTDPFRPPPCPWCAGNRGIEYRTAHTAEVWSVAAGSVSFSGSVAGTLYVVVELTNGWRLTYGRLADTHLRTGNVVLGGSRIGRTGGELFFGLRIGDTYHDPASYLGHWEGSARLIPTDGSKARPAPPALLRCTPEPPPSVSDT